MSQDIRHPRIIYRDPSPFLPSVTQFSVWLRSFRETSSVLTLPGDGGPRVVEGGKTGVLVATVLDGSLVVPLPTSGPCHVASSPVPFLATGAVHSTTPRRSHPSQICFRWNGNRESGRGWRWSEWGGQDLLVRTTGRGGPGGPLCTSSRSTASHTEGYGSSGNSTRYSSTSSPQTPTCSTTTFTPGSSTSSWTSMDDDGEGPSGGRTGNGTTPAGEKQGLGGHSGSGPRTDWVPGCRTEVYL